MQRDVALLRRYVVKHQPPLIEEVAACSAWALNTYLGCEFRCVYCITAAQGDSYPTYPRDELVPKLREELAALGPDICLMVGTLRDAYPSVEREHRVTRAALEELDAQGYGFGIVTKGTLVLRDVDLLARRADRTVQVSLCTVDDDALHHVDPKAPSAAERLTTVHALRDAGVCVSVNAEPWIPSVSDAGAIRDAVDDDIPVRFAPLNVVNPLVVDTPYGRRFRQPEINDAYRREFERVGPLPNVAWVRPISCPGSEPEHHPFAELGEADRRPCNEHPLPVPEVAAS
jgi:hypothetical protein